MTTATGKKSTVATVKSFIRKNRAALLVRVKSRFDGMQDMVVANDSSGFSPAAVREYFCHDTHKWIAYSSDDRNSMGLMGVWFTGRDWCRPIETATHRGYEVQNCCGTWSVAVPKNENEI